MTIIFLVISIIAFINIVVLAIFDRIIPCVICLIIGLTALILSIYFDSKENPTEHKPKVIEYSTSKYELSYKYIIQDNTIDTIYVINEK